MVMLDKIKKIIEFLKVTFALNTLIVIFDNDEHKIITNKRQEILKNYENN